nr:unnamed protein product [Callosobruchus chinensis]
MEKILKNLLPLASTEIFSIPNSTSASLNQKKTSVMCAQSST